MLERVWIKHESLFRRIASSILINRSIIDDVLQETYVRILRNGRRFDDEQEAFNYLRRALINTSLDFYRRTCRYAHRVRASEDLTLLPGSVSEAPSPLDEVLQDEGARHQRLLLGRVRRAVRRLPAPQREAVELVFNRAPDTPIKEVCRRNRIPYSTLRSRLLRAFELIRRDLGEERETASRGEECHEV